MEDKEMLLSTYGLRMRGGEMGSGSGEELVVVVVVVVMVDRLSILLTRGDRCWVEVEGNPRLPLVLEVVSERLHVDLMLERHRLLPVLVNIMEPRIVILSVRWLPCRHLAIRAEGKGQEDKVEGEELEVEEVLLVVGVEGKEVGEQKARLLRLQQVSRYCG